MHLVLLTEAELLFQRSIKITVMKRQKQLKMQTMKFRRKIKKDMAKMMARFSTNSWKADHWKQRRGLLQRREVVLRATSWEKTKEKKDQAIQKVYLLYEINNPKSMLLWENFLLTMDQTVTRWEFDVFSQYTPWEGLEEGLGGGGHTHL